MSCESPKVALVAMRLMDMTRYHPQQDNSHVCSACQAQVGIYPTGQRVLSHNKGVAILCHVCAVRDHNPDDFGLPAGTWREMMQEKRDSVPAGKA